MPIWADPARGEQVRLLADDDMTLLGMFLAPPSARPTAADMRVVPGTDMGRFAEVAIRDLPGARVTTRLDEAAALVAAGASVGLTLVHMVRDRLEEDPPPLRWAAPDLAAGLEMVPIETLAEDDLATAQRLAFGPGHPEHQATLEAQGAGRLHALLTGGLLGPLYSDASAAVVDATGRIVACLIATQWEGIGDEWSGGPWLVDLFAVPGAPLLLGRSLLARAVAVCALDGHAATGLTVNSANRARQLYRRMGFRDSFYRVSLDIPGTWSTL